MQAVHAQSGGKGHRFAATSGGNSSLRVSIYMSKRYLFIFFFFFFFGGFPLCDWNPAAVVSAELALNNVPQIYCVLVVLDLLVVPSKIVFCELEWAASW